MYQSYGFSIVQICRVYLGNNLLTLKSFFLIRILFCFYYFLLSKTWFCSKLDEQSNFQKEDKFEPCPKMTLGILDRISFWTFLFSPCHESLLSYHVHFKKSVKILCSNQNVPVQFSQVSNDLLVDLYPLTLLHFLKIVL